jgi:predicted DNA-binding transcriptional regulator AlpA
MAGLFSTSAIFPPIELPPEIARQRVVDEKTAAEFVGLAAITLERARKAGTGPRHVRLSERRIGYRVCDLVAWLDTRLSETAAA